MRDFLRLVIWQYRFWRSEGIGSLGAVCRSGWKVAQANPWLLGLLLCLCLVAIGRAQDVVQRERAALPYIVEQRNNALDGVALCNGDLGVARTQLAALVEQLKEARATIDQLRAHRAQEGDQP